MFGAARRSAPVTRSVDVGQAALNGVLVLSAVEEQRATGLPLEAAIEAGAASRLRAVLMTAALAALGLVPAALSHAMGAEMHRPMAVVIVRETVSAAVLTRLVLPAMYRLTQPLFERLVRRCPHLEGTPSPAE